MAASGWRWIIVAGMIAEHVVCKGPRCSHSRTCMLHVPAHVVADLAWAQYQISARLALGSRSLAIHHCAWRASVSDGGGGAGSTLRAAQAQCPARF